MSVGRPEMARAVVTADGPGMGTTSKPLSMVALINSYPGSDMPGIPASETSATSSCCSVSRIASSLVSLLCSQ